jgi:hypothetical protein
MRSQKQTGGISFSEMNSQITAIRDTLTQKSLLTMVEIEEMDLWNENSNNSLFSVMNFWSRDLHRAVDLSRTRQSIGSP